MSNKNQEFDLFVALFEAFLKHNKAHTNYFNEWIKHHEYTGSANVFYAWRQWAILYTYKDWISNAFFWKGTKKGFDYWLHMECMWVNCCQDNNIQKTISDLKCKK